MERVMQQNPCLKPHPNKFSEARLMYHLCSLTQNSILRDEENIWAADHLLVT